MAMLWMLPIAPNVLTYHKKNKQITSLMLELMYDNYLPSVLINWIILFVNISN